MQDIEGDETNRRSTEQTGPGQQSQNRAMLVAALKTDREQDVELAASVVFLLQHMAPLQLQPATHLLMPP